MPNKALQPTPSRFAGWGCSVPLLAAHLGVGLIARSGWLSLTFGFTMSNSTYLVNRYVSGEEAILWKIYYDTTHIVNGRDYTPAQCERWAPSNKDINEWADRIRLKNPFVVRHQQSILGFAELDRDGHIDYFYVHHRWTRKGIGRLLYIAIEHEANDKRISIGDCSKAEFSPVQKRTAILEAEVA